MIRSWSQQNTLYRFVFLSPFARGLVLALFISFLLQPLPLALAAETVPPEPESQTANDLDEVEPVIDENSAVDLVNEPAAAPVPDDEPAALTVEATAAASSPSPAESEPIPAASPESTTAPTATPDEAGSPSATATPITNASSAEVADESTATTSSSVASPATGTATTTIVWPSVVSDAPTTSASSTDELGIQPTASTTSPSTTPAATDVLGATTTASSSDPVDDTESPPVETHAPESDPSVLNESLPSLDDQSKLPATTTTPAPADPILTSHNLGNYYQFGKTDCVTVGAGAFYCHDKQNVGSPVSDQTYAARDAEGDLEIYFQNGDDVAQITDNAFDDDAPEYDPVSGTIVFHRLLNGRYQIFAYDLQQKNETQLTETSENNMEPHRNGAVTVWQTWVEGNWEIALFNGQETRRITNNDYHDVAPTVRDGYVMWQTTTNAGEKLLSVYEVATGHQSTIADPDGGHVENPRFVLIYDTEYANGDRVTKQYDPETGAITPVGSDPAPVPTQVPPPDSTGETRALINAKSSGRGEGEEFDDFGSGSSTPDVIGPNPMATTSAATTTPTAASNDLDLRASSTQPTPLTEFDLVISPPATSSSATLSTTTSTSSAGGA